MLNDLFYGMRDIRNQYKEMSVTTNRVGEPIEFLTTRQCNVRIDVNGLDEDVKLYIKFEESADSIAWTEIGTFLIPDSHHGVLFAKFKPYIRYTLIINGQTAGMDVNINF